MDHFWPITKMFAPENKLALSNLVCAATTPGEPGLRFGAMATDLAYTSGAFEKSAPI